MRVGVKCKGLIVQEFESLEECAKKFGISKNDLMQYLKHKTTFGGERYKFIYLPSKKAKEEKIE